MLMKLCKKIAEPWKRKRSNDTEAKKRELKRGLCLFMIFDLTMVIMLFCFKSFYETKFAIFLLSYLISCQLFILWALPLLSRKFKQLHMRSKND